jgi:hypothetical protein
MNADKLLEKATKFWLTLTVVLQIIMLFNLASNVLLSHFDNINTWSYKDLVVRLYNRIIRDLK